MKKLTWASGLGLILLVASLWMDQKPNNESSEKDEANKCVICLEFEE